MTPEERRERDRAYYLEHRDAVRARQAAYDATHKAEKAARSRASGAAYREAHREERRAWRAAHPDPRQPVESKSCPECGAPFVGTPGRRFCSPAHAGKYHRRQYRHRQRVAVLLAGMRAYPCVRCIECVRISHDPATHYM